MSVSATVLLVASLAVLQQVTADCASDADTVVNSYLQDIGSGNVSGACAYISPGFVFTWHGSANLVPIAGTYIGCTGLTAFFSKVNQVVKDFTFYQPFAPTSFGIRTLGTGCSGTTGTVVKQWEEVSMVIATGRPVTQAINTVVYTVDTSVSPFKLLTGDVFIDVTQYATAFCSGEVACFDSGAVVTGSSTSLSSQSSVNSVLGLVAVTFVASLVTAVLSLIIFFKGRQQTSDPSDYAAYTNSIN